MHSERHLLTLRSVVKVNRISLWLINFSTDLRFVNGLPDSFYTHVLQYFDFEKYRNYNTLASLVLVLTGPVHSGNQTMMMMMRVRTNRHSSKYDMCHLVLPANHSNIHNLWQHQGHKSLCLNHWQMMVMMTGMTQKI